LLALCAVALVAVEGSVSSKLMNMKAKIAGTTKNDDSFIIPELVDSLPSFREVPAGKETTFKGLSANAPSTLADQRKARIARNLNGIKSGSTQTTVANNAAVTEQAAIKVEQQAATELSAAKAAEQSLAAEVATAKVETKATEQAAQTAAAEAKAAQDAAIASAATETSKDAPPASPPQSDADASAAENPSPAAGDATPTSNGPADAADNSADGADNSADANAAADAPVEDAEVAQVDNDAKTVESAADKVASEEKSVAEAAAAEQAVSEKLDQVESKVSEDESLAKAEAPAAAVSAPAECPTCHDDKPVYVGRKNIPAEDTRSVLVLGNPEDNKEIEDKVETPENLLTDPAEIHDVEDSLPAVSDQIQDIHDKVEAIKNAPLVPPTDEADS